MSKKVLALTYFLKFSEVELKKDVGLFPIYLRRLYFDSAIIYYPNDGKINVPKYYNGINLVGIKIDSFDTDPSKNRNFLTRLISKMKENHVTHLMFFHYQFAHFSFARMAKKAIPGIKTYLKLDASPDNIEKIIKPDNKLIGFLSHFFVNRYVDLVTTETYDGIKTLNSINCMRGKVFFAPNGYDDDLFSMTNKSEKEKLIITVGRLFTPPKNTKLLLRIIERLQLKDWKVKLIGPVKDEYKSQVYEFYNRRPELKGKVEFTGNISDSNILTNYYKKASVFVLCSRWEGSALVTVEAMLNGDHIISTDVGSIRTISGNEELCDISPESMQNHQNEDAIFDFFTVRLQAIIDGRIDPLEKMNEQIKVGQDKYLMGKIAGQNFYKEWAK